MPQNIYLPLGEHALLEPVVDWDIEFVSETVHSVKLTASIRSQPVPPFLLAGRRTATTLAIQMDRVAATALSERIRELARSMGWPLPSEGEPQA